jgi:hypothetical protein
VPRLAIREYLLPDHEHAGFGSLLYDENGECAMISPKHSVGRSPMPRKCSDEAGSGLCKKGERSSPALNKSPPRTSAWIVSCPFAD